MGFEMDNRGRRVKVTGVGKPQEDKAMPKKCRHIIRHPVTDEERKEISKQLEYSRSIGDGMGIRMALAQLRGCPSKAKGGS